MMDGAKTSAIDTVIVGGGPAGLAVSWLLSAAGRAHVVFEADRMGSSWRSRRWDSLCLSGANYHHDLPGWSYADDDPDGCMTHAEMTAWLEAYARSFCPPVREGVRAIAVDASSGKHRFRIETTDGAYRANHVVLATGSNRVPRIPAAAAELPTDLAQMPALAYQNPASMCPGAVLIVGSGQSAVQIADELARYGRRVYLAVRRCWWWPFRYRGHDTFWWMVEQGLLKRPAPPPTSPLASISPQVTGVDGGRTLNLHTLARDGVVVLGSFAGVAGRTLRFAPDLAEHVDAADQQARTIIDGIDAFATERGMTALAPDDIRGNTALWTHEAIDPIRALDLDAAGIATVIWATGYRPAFEWVHLPAFDAAGAPRHEYGIGDYPGLYFPALHLADSFPGITLDAAAISGVILARAPTPM